MVGGAVRRRLGPAVVAVLALALLPGVAGPAAPAAAAACRSDAVATPPHIGGVARARTGCPAARPAARSLSTAAYTYAGTPPLAYHGGPVMGTANTFGPPHITLTPIFWAPDGHAFPPGYLTLVTRYLTDLAADSGRLTNVFAATPEFSGSNGAVAYNLRVGPAITDSTPYPGSGCTLSPGPVYADGSAYTDCLDDTQVQAEITAQATGGGLGRLYLMFLPQGVESCFSPDNPSDQACTINSSASSSYCGYHGTIDPDLIYANLPFPVYSSPSAGHSSCTDENLDPVHPGTVQSPNGNVAADVVLSTTSHEIAEAITDPHIDAWLTDDASGSENGDMCAYDYGALAGSSGVRHNQTINGHQYLTQTEFSNVVWARGHYACVATMPVPSAPAVTGVGPRSGPDSGTRTLTISGTGFTGATQVTIGGLAVRFTVRTPTRIVAITRPHATGTVDVRVTTPGGRSVAVTADRYRFGPAVPVSVSPTAGPTSGGRVVTLAGSGFTGATGVRFGSFAAHFTVTSDARIAAVTPAHGSTTVSVTVVNGAGSSPVSSAPRYVFLPRPRVLGVSPAGGTTRGGRTVTITGSGFYRVASVRFGYTAAAFTVDSPTRITVRTPAHAAGPVNVLVTTPAGTSAVTTADRYRFG